MKKALISAGILSTSEILDILNLAEALQRAADSDGVPPLLRGKAIALVFDETSLRTRAAFQRAAEDLGAQAHVYSGAEIRLGRNAKKQEYLPDLANVIGRFYDCVVSRVYDTVVQERFAALLPIPFINGMCNVHHPTQALCDLLTIQRRFKRLQGVKIAFVGDATNVALSLAQLAARVGANFAIACPESVSFPNEAEVGVSFVRTSDPVEAVSGAHVLIADTWVPMGKDGERQERIDLLSPYRVTTALLKHGAKDLIFMHNLPAVRGEEVESEVIDGAQSVVYEEAVARLHVARAILLWALYPSWRDLTANKSVR